MDTHNRIYTSEQPAPEDKQRLRDTYQAASPEDRAVLEQKMTDLDEDLAAREINVLRRHLSQP